MRTVSSAERACSEPASSSGATATVAIPSSRQARKTRSAISPRFATRSFWMPTTASRFSRKARRPSWPSSLVRRWAMRRSVPRPSGRSSTSFFACRAASGPAVRSSATIRCDGRVEILGHLVDEADPQRGRRVEALARDEVAPRRARADLRQRVRRDHGRDDPELHLREGEQRVRRRDHDVRASDEAAAAAERMAVHARHDRRRAGVDRLQHLPQPARVGDVLLVAELDRAAHPVDVGAGGEALALAGQQHRAHVVADRPERLGQLARSARRRRRCAARGAPS